MIRSVIERRPWAIILAWIVVVALLAQYAGQLNNVVQTQTEKFLPQNVESVRADEALKRIQEEYGVSAASKPDYIVLVHGVPVSLDTYYKLRDPYMRLYHEYNESIFNWINIVYQVEEQITNNTRTGINNTIPALQGLVALDQAYNATLQGLNQTIPLVAGLDQAYARITMAVEELAMQRGNLTRLEQAYLASCNMLVPAVGGAYYNVSRTEYYLETLTNAYQTGNLTQEDILKVVEATNQSSLGIKPVPPQLVPIVYYYVLQHGGPQYFNDTQAVILAGQLVWENLRAANETVPEQLLNATVRAWTIVVGNKSYPGFRAILSSQPQPGEAQLELLKAVEQASQQAKTIVRILLEEYYSKSLPQPTATLAKLIGEELANTSCNESLAGEALVNAVTRFLAEQGLPNTPLLKTIAYQAVIGGTVNKTLTLELATRLVAANMTSRGIPVENATRLARAAARIVETMDPQARGNITGSTAVQAAALLVLESRGISVNQTILEGVAANSTSVEREAAYLLQIMLEAEGKREALSLLRLLEEKHLLGAPEAVLLREAPSLLAPMIAGKANITVEQAAAIVRAAVAVYNGSASLDEEAARLARNALEKAWPKIVAEMRGTLVEKDLNGFLTVYTPPANASLEEGVQGLENVSKGLQGILESSGFKSFKIYLGGNQYMTWEMRRAAQQDIERSDRISMVLVIIILALVLESIAAVLLPFIGIGMGLVASMAIAYFLARQGLIEVTTHSRTIMYTTGLGLGIDYAAYVSKRFREAAARGLDSRTAAGEAFEKSWKAVMAGALTAAIGFGSMLLARDFPFITSIGSNVPLTIIGVMIASITFIPALLAYVGEKNWFWWPRHPVETAKKEKRSLAAATVGRLARNPIVPLAIIVVMAVGAYAVMSGFHGSYDLTLNLPRDSMSAKTIEAINKYYDPGVLYPVYIIPSDPAKAQAIADAVGKLQCVSHVLIPEKYHGRVVFAYMSANPLSAEGVDCAAKIRSTAHSVDPGSLVGGMSAVNLDLKNLINTIFYHRVYPVAITLMFLTFLAAYGGVAVALSAVIAVALAAYAGSALTIIVYQHFLGTPVLWYLPVIVFTAILGVGMDYNSFFIARSREECERNCSIDGLLEAIRHATPIVLGLATIMAGAYIGLAATKTPGLSEMGTALVLGVLLAGLNAAVLLTPPIIALLGRRAWWPRHPRGGESNA